MTTPLSPSPAAPASGVERKSPPPSAPAGAAHGTARRETRGLVLVAAGAATLCLLTAIGFNLVVTHELTSGFADGQRSGAAAPAASAPATPATSTPAGMPAAAGPGGGTPASDATAPGAAGAGAAPASTGTGASAGTGAAAAPQASEGAGGPQAPAR